MTYVALHAAISGGDRLVWLSDLDALARQGQIRWDVLIDRACPAGLARPSAGVMLRTERKPCLARTRSRTERSAGPAATDGWPWSQLMGGYERFRLRWGIAMAVMFRGQVLDAGDTQWHGNEPAQRAARLTRTDLLGLRAAGRRLTRGASGHAKSSPLAKRSDHAGAMRRAIVLRAHGRLIELVADDHVLEMARERLPDSYRPGRGHVERFWEVTEEFEDGNWTSELSTNASWRTPSR